MGGFVDIASAILAQSERRAEVSAQNIANLTTPGFKSYLNFDAFVKSESDFSAVQAALAPRDFSAGALTVTDRPLDLAVQGEGFFTLMSPSGPLYTRNGQFQRDADGRLVSSSGLPVMGAGMSEIRLPNENVEVLSDGLVLADGEPAGRLLLTTFLDMTALSSADGGVFASPEENISDPESFSIVQGALEASNVSTATEMVTLMESVRRAEAGQRIVGIYDELMGRVITSLGR